MFAALEQRKHFLRHLLLGHRTSVVGAVTGLVPVDAVGMTAGAVFMFMVPLL